MINSRKINSTKINSQLPMKSTPAKSTQTHYAMFISSMHEKPHSYKQPDWLFRLKKVVGKTHPNIYKIFKKEETTVRMKMQNFETGVTQAPRRRSERRREEA